MLNRLAMLTLCLTPWATWAKCGNSAILIDGLISGSPRGCTVSVQVEPDPNWNRQPEAVIDENGHFHATVYFDRTQPGRRERCSRKPRLIKVQLYRGSQLVGEIDLEAKRDLVSTGDVDYRVRSPITLNAH